MLYRDGEFEWETEKAEINFGKHNTSFEEASRAFDDPLAVEVFDEEHSINEARYQLIGLSDRRLLFVVFTLRGQRKRIIHARRATKSMEQLYAEQNPQL